MEDDYSHLDWSKAERGKFYNKEDNMESFNYVDEISELHMKVATLEKMLNGSVERNFQKILDRIEFLENRNKEVIEPNYLRHENRIETLEGRLKNTIEENQHRHERKIHALNEELEQLRNIINSANPNIVHRLMALEEAAGICEECHTIDGHKMDCSKNNVEFPNEPFMAECWGDRPEWKMPENRKNDVEWTLLREVEELEIKLADKIEELAQERIDHEVEISELEKELDDMKFSRDLQESNFHTALKMSNDQGSEADKWKAQAEDWMEQRDFWKEKYGESQNKLSKTISLIYNGED